MRTTFVFCRYNQAARMYDIPVAKLVLTDMNELRRQLKKAYDIFTETGYDVSVLRTSFSSLGTYTVYPLRDRQGRLHDAFGRFLPTSMPLMDDRHQIYIDNGGFTFQIMRQDSVTQWIHDIHAPHVPWPDSPFQDIPDKSIYYRSTELVEA